MTDFNICHRIFLIRPIRNPLAGDGFSSSGVWQTSGFGGETQKTKGAAHAAAPLPGKMGYEMKF
ncbi:hypothetical protein MTX26_13290 [Bradyrhizobium sp. ISRA443]|uniref:hypothetical protein n=1 Tax=unclassified Bradyrhizobium TaxID=2631580 RepID=UPI00247B2BDE|nr:MULTISPECIES: hypothetical protein [unclassified Bradyrhizobium]WGS01729.1 hypothetical protein MTX23_13300 [Bradyrhizobium sp. ISRA436]WGS08615.1 hypothetical protein MTX18_13290 [Bradyrhizobium sp. ISRA437]WGS15503.1 hypothetical protein MTX26_13290 [Bradyrhizobium sp. ISRA443]